MGWFDPIECKAARDYLARGQLKEAARELLTGKNRDHRSVKLLLIEVGRRLIEQAEREADAGLWEASRETLAIAGKCITLEGQALALQQRIEAALAEKRRQAARQAEWLAAANRKLAEARDLVQMGEFGPALQLLEPLQSGGFSGASELAEEIRLITERFKQAITDCENAITAGDEGLARLHWEKVRKLCPKSPEVKRLAADLARMNAARDSKVRKASPVTSRKQQFVVDEIGLILLSDEIGIGVPNGDNVQLPILGRIHRRHAVLARDRQGWQIVTCRDKYGRACPVRIDGVPVDSAARLKDGNVVQLGDTECLWRFRQPVPGSLTAIWEALPGSLSGILLPEGKSVRRAILLADQLILGVMPPAHLVNPRLPCESLCLHWHENALHWKVNGGSAIMEIPGVTWQSDDFRVYLPSRLMIDGQWDEAERLGRMLLKSEEQERIVLSFSTWER